MLLNEYEIEFMFRKIRNIRNLGNVHTRGPHIVMSRTDAQNGLDFPFKGSLARFSFEPRFSEVDKSLFLVPPLRATSCNVHYSGSILSDNERETWSKSNSTLAQTVQDYIQGILLEK
jgi:hypothetical protein